MGKLSFPRRGELYHASERQNMKRVSAIKAVRSHAQHEKLKRA